MQRRVRRRPARPGRLQPLQRRVEERGARRRVAGEQPRSRCRRERNRGHELRIVAAAVAAVGVGPRPVEDVFAVRMRLLVERQGAGQRCAAPRGQEARRPPGAPATRSRSRAARSGTRARGAACRRRARSTRRHRSLDGDVVAQGEAFDERGAGEGRVERVHRKGRFSRGPASRAMLARQDRTIGGLVHGGDAGTRAKLFAVDVHRHADRPRAAQSGRRRPPRQRAGHPGGGEATRSAPARASSSRPSSRCAAIRPRTWCCARRSSTPARASSRRWPAACGRRRSSSAFPSATAAAATTRSPCCATAASTRVYRKQQLPNYTVFDEERYFEPGHAPCVIDVDGTRCRPHHLRGRLVPRPGAAGEGGGRARDRRRQRLALSHAAAGGAARAGRRAGARDRAAVRLRQSRRRPGRARLRRRVVRRGARTATSSSSCRRGTRRWRSRRSTTACRSRCAARSTRGSRTTSTRRW